MHERAEGFRRQVEQHFGGRPGRGARYPETVRVEGIAITDWLVTRGASLGEVAGRLGLGVAATLRRWLNSPPEEIPELRPVELIETEETQVVRNGSCGSLSLITAGGHQVEGLEVDEVALLLEALG